MKQKLALMCTLLHKPRVLFLDEPTNGVDPVSRRDFWAILYQLVRDGLTVFVTTAYLDEAERANRVGFMYQGRMIRCDTPAALKHGIEETVLPGRLRTIRRKTRAILRRAARRADACSRRAPICTCFWIRARHRRPRSWLIVTPFAFQPIAPSLEDVFIALVRKEECAACMPKTQSGPPSTSITGEALRRFRGRGRRFDRRRARRDLRIPGAQRRGQIDHHPHPLRAARADFGQRHGGRLRCRDAAGR